MRKRRRVIRKSGRRRRQRPDERPFGKWLVMAGEENPGVPCILESGVRDVLAM